MDSDSCVELRSDTGTVLELPAESITSSEAMRWAYVASHRSRWQRRSTGAAHDSLAEHARATLCTAGVRQEQIEALAEASVVQVSTGFAAEDADWQLRVLPWEFLLSSATRGLRGTDFTVVRHLHRIGEPLQPPRAPATLLTVDLHGSSSAGVDSALEHRLISGFGALARIDRLVEPIVPQLRERIQHTAPDVIHVAGMAPDETAVLSPTTVSDDPAWRRDGLVARMAHGQSPAPVGAHTAASILTAGTPTPRLVSLHTAGSAPRVAPLVVAAGADAAIGFQDRFDLASAQLLFASLAHAGRLSGWDLLIAFCAALGTLRRSGTALRGTGVVLWSAHPLLSNETGTVSAAVHELEPRNLAERVQPAATAEVTTGAVRETVEARVRPLSGLNYGLLHNRRSVFETFRLIHHAPGTIRNVHVEVALHLGEGAFPYRCTLDLTEPVTDLTDRIRLPLTAHLLQSIEESVHTSLFVHVSVDDSTGSHAGACRTVLRDTYPVRLLPPDEWRDTDADRQWLPSFVLPRDPAVARTIDAAHRHLVVLADDPHRGFDGYQRTPGNTQPEAVDLQVRAVWSCLLYDVSPRYITPPPVYTPTSQRLRRPTEVVAGHRGTCIDLALLLTACLEYLEIYPVVFLLSGHAFPGYWRSWESYAAFQELASALANHDTRVSWPVPASSSVPWIIGADAYDELIQQVVQGHLAPIETVDLTRSLGFFDAVENGERHLGSRFEFEGMVDITRARECGVTPLPLGGSRDG